MRHFAFVLRSERRFPALQQSDCFHDSFAAENRKSVKKLACGFFFAYRRCLFKQHVACVHRFYGAHNGDSALFVAVDYRPLNRRGTSVFRQQRSVNVEHSEFRNCQKALAQYLTERRRYDDVGIEISHIVKPFSRHFFVLQDGNTQLLRLDFERRGFELISAPGGLVKPRYDARYRIYRIKFFKHDCREVGRAHKHYFHI